MAQGMHGKADLPSDYNGVEKPVRNGASFHLHGVVQGIWEHATSKEDIMPQYMWLDLVFTTYLEVGMEKHYLLTHYILQFTI